MTSNRVFKTSSTRLTKWGSMIAAIISLGGCATTAVDQTTSPEEAELIIKYVGRDMLTAASQIFPSNSTTIQLGKPRTPFGKELENGFREIGFGMQRVGADQGTHFLTYAESTSRTGNNRKTYNYSLSIGRVEMSRDYILLPDRGIYPAGPMYISGTSKQVVLNKDLFHSQSSDVNFVSTVEYREAAQFDQPKVTLFSQELIEDIIKGEKSQLPSYKTLNSQNMEIKNLFSTGSSNFESVTEEYRVVRKDTIVFGNDSLRLGTRGKSQLDKLRGYYNEATDIFRLVGCSNGVTSYSGGNEGLALGRSKRVAEALLASGINSDSILDEGCWAPTSAGDRFPARGVMVELKRKKT